MPPARQPYRIELLQQAGRLPGSIDDRRSIDDRLGEPCGDEAGEQQLSEIVGTLRELKQFLDPSHRLATDVIEAYRREIAEVYQLRIELDGMREAIEGTKREVAAIRRSDSEGKGIRRASNELGAVADDTERAASAILSATEDIEAEARRLRDAAVGSEDVARIEVVLARVVALYEACNFQDLAGQRISKIVDVLQFIEGRLNRVLAAWGPAEATAEAASRARAALPQGEQARREAAAEPETAPHQPLPQPSPREASAERRPALLNGPALPDASGHISQDEIDRLFD
jgi:chemotaxis protein CheZ